METPSRDQETSLRNPRDFGKPLAMGAPEPMLEIPVKPSRVIHFFDPGTPHGGPRPGHRPQGGHRPGEPGDAIAVDRKDAARAG